MLIERSDEFYFIPPHGKNLQWYESYERTLLLKRKIQMISVLIEQADENKPSGHLKNDMW